MALYCESEGGHTYVSIWRRAKKRTSASQLVFASARGVGRTVHRGRDRDGACGGRVDVTKHERELLDPVITDVSKRYVGRIVSNSTNEKLKAEK